MRYIANGEILMVTPTHFKHRTRGVIRRFRTDDAPACTKHGAYGKAGRAAAQPFTTTHGVYTIAFTAVEKSERRACADAARSYAMLP